MQKQWRAVVTDVQHAVLSKEICDYELLIISGLIVATLII